MHINDKMKNRHEPVHLCQRSNLTNRIPPEKNNHILCMVEANILSII